MQKNLEFTLGMKNEKFKENLNKSRVFAKETFRKMENDSKKMNIFRGAEESFKKAKDRMSAFESTHKEKIEKIKEDRNKANSKMKSSAMVFGLAGLAGKFAVDYEANKILLQQKLGLFKTNKEINKMSVEERENHLTRTKKLDMQAENLAKNSRFTQKMIQ